jgi:2-polyprenyl-6-hydroxyphenyl methylase/3-demethylubiquinone-9 3-methyltransferase
MINADQSELEKFSQLAHRWWDPGSDFKPLHDINPLRLDWIDGHLPARRQAGARRRLRWWSAFRRHVRKGRDGDRHRSLRQGAQCGPSASARKRAQVDYRKIAPKNWLPRRPAATMSSPAWKCSNTYPIRRVRSPLARHWSSLAGTSSFSTINRNPKAYLLAVIGAEYVLQMLPRGTHDYARFIKPSELLALGKGCRSRSGRFAGNDLQSLYRQYALGRDTDVNYLLHTVKNV